MLLMCAVEITKELDGLDTTKSKLGIVLDLLYGRALSLHTNPKERSN